MKYNGEFIFTDKETGQNTHFGSLQCAHCGIHWQVMKGSGRIRGYCFACSGYLCGQKVCMQHHFPKEAQIEAVEAIDQGRFSIAKKLIDRYGQGVILNGYLGK